MAFRLVFRGWRIVGEVLIIDDDGDAISLGTDPQGRELTSAQVDFPVKRFRGNEFVEAYNNARKACDDLLEKNTPKETSGFISRNQDSNACVMCAGELEVRNGFNYCPRCAASSSLPSKSAQRLID